MSPMRPNYRPGLMDLHLDSLIGLEVVSVAVPWSICMNVKCLDFVVYKTRQIEVTIPWESNVDLLLVTAKRGLIYE